MSSKQGVTLMWGAQLGKPVTIQWADRFGQMYADSSLVPWFEKGIFDVEFIRANQAAGIYA